MLLSIAELVALTGYRRRGCIIRWLSQNGFAFRVGADGYPRVLEEHVRSQLGGNAFKQRSVPNLSVLKKASVHNGSPS